MSSLHLHQSHLDSWWRCYKPGPCRYTRSCRTGTDERDMQHEDLHTQYWGHVRHSTAKNHEVLIEETEKARHIAHLQMEMHPVKYYLIIFSFPCFIILFFFIFGPQQIAHVKDSQSISSLSSEQSFTPSHLHAFGMHWVPEAQDHWNSLHVTGPVSQL